MLSMTAVYSLSLAGIALVEQRTHSTVQAGLVLLSSLLPAFLASLVAGAVVDRLGRRTMLLLSHLARALVALVFWVGMKWLPADLMLPAIFVVNVVGVSCTQFAAPAEMALLPDLVNPSHLASANGLFQLSLLAAEGLGIVVIGPVAIKLAGAPVLGLIGTILCLAALRLVAAVPRETSREDTAAWRGVAALRSDLGVGWRAIADDRQLRLVTVQATLVGVLLLALVSLVPGLASRHLGLHAEDAPSLLLPGGIGFVVGIALLGRRERWLSRVGWTTLGLTGLGAMLALISLLSVEGGGLRIWIIRALILIVGLGMSMVIIPARTLLQERSPAHVRGRVMGAQLALGNAAAVIVVLTGGLLADSLGIRPVMGLLAMVAMGAGALGLYQANG